MFKFDFIEEEKETEKPHEDPSLQKIESNPVIEDKIGVQGKIQIWCT